MANSGRMSKTKKTFGAQDESKFHKARDTDKEQRGGRQDKLKERNPKTELSGKASIRKQFPLQM